MVYHDTVIDSPETSPEERVMSKPHKQGTNGQFNDEFDSNAFEKCRKMHYIPRKVNCDEWTSNAGTGGVTAMTDGAMPNVANLPSSCDDEFFGDYIVTTRDVSMVRNAAANSLTALTARATFDQEIDISEDNCLKALECAAQQYAWGKIGSGALVARIKAAQHDDGSFEIQEDKPYAELWVGTHPNGMSNIVLPSKDGSSSRTVPLVDYVQSNPEMHLGIEGETKQSEEFDLTFLFKVLSIEKVLSIQAHPDKNLAAQLYTDRPEVYKDPNHKPEMAVALTDDFEAMSGFRPIFDITANLLDYPEFTDLIGDVRRDLLEFVAGRRGINPKPILQKMFHTYITTDDAKLKKNLNQLSDRLEQKDTPTDLDVLILKLSKQFPGDSGIFAPIIFNYLKLKTGDAFYIGANEPHAYIQGEILECMACSDNVVRAGLTPKLKDVDTLVKMLTYKCTKPSITRGTRKDANCTLYVPPIDDFAMEIVEVKPGERYEMKDVRSPSVLLALKGSGCLEQEYMELPMAFGKAAFMSANTRATIVADRDGEGLKLVRALSNVHM